MTAGTLSGGGRTPGYRRRRPLPALIMLLVLGLGAAIVWLQVMDSDSEQAEGARCAPPAQPSAEPGQPAPQPPALGEHVAQTGLDEQPAPPPAQVLVKVLNAGTQRGLAALVTENLRQLGFSQVGTPAGDPVYPEGDLTCRGQIRFGPQGAAAARTLSLLEPCAELMKDNRADATVDFVIGRKFDELPIRSETRQLLRQLAEWEAANPAQGGGLQSAPQAGPQPDPALVQTIRKTTC